MVFFSSLNSTVVIQIVTASRIYPHPEKAQPVPCPKLHPKSLSKTFTLVKTLSRALVSLHPEIVLQYLLCDAIIYYYRSHILIIRSVTSGNCTYYYYCPYFSGGNFGRSFEHFTSIAKQKRHRLRLYTANCPPVIF